MFTGIIENTGQILKKGKHSLVIKVSALVDKLKIGSSIAVDGVCLTVTERNLDSFKVDVMPITLERTTLRGRKKGDWVNLELAMLASDRFDGHVVSGHVEGEAELLSMHILENAYHLKFKLLNKNLDKYIVQTGSIAINGISLTVIYIEGEQFEVGIIPHTWENTNLQNLSLGSKVNVETDIMAKYAEKINQNLT